jgi:hypothetical protein
MSSRKRLEGHRPRKIRVSPSLPAQEGVHGSQATSLKDALLLAFITDTDASQWRRWILRTL